MQKDKFTRINDCSRMKEFSNFIGNYHKANFRGKKE